MENVLQMNFFDCLEEKSEEQIYLEKDLKRGSCFANGKYRIAFAYLHKKIGKLEFITFIREEYGTGGYSANDYFQDHNEKGITLRVNQRVGEPIKYQFSWSRVANEIIDLIQKGEYFNREEQKVFDNYVAQRIGSDASRIKAMAQYCYNRSKQLFLRMGNFYQGFHFGEVKLGAFFNEHIEDVKKEVEKIGKDIKEVRVYKEFGGYNLRILF